MTSNRPFLRRVVINTMATGVSNAWAIVISLLTLPLMLGGLGSDAFGLWVVVQTFSVFTGWGALVDLGLGTAATRAIAARASREDGEGCDRLATGSLVGTVALAAVAGVALATAGPVLLPHVFETSSELEAGFRTAIVLFGAQMVVDQMSRGVERILEGLNRIDLARLLSSARRTAVAGATAVAAQLTGDLEAVAMVSLAVSVPAALAALFVAARFARPRMIRRAEARELAAYGVRVGAMKPLGTLHRTMDRIVVGAVLGPSAVTIVEIATQVQNGAEAFLSASSYAVMPSSSWLDARGDTATQRRLLLLGTKYSFLITLPLVIGPAILAPDLLAVWVPDDGSGAAASVVIALSYTAVTAPAQVSSEMLVGLGRVGLVFRAALGALAVNLAATVFLVSEIGVEGAFIGSLTGAPLLLWIILGGALREVGVSPRDMARTCLWPALRPTCALAVVTATVVAAIGPSLPAVAAGTVAGAAVYPLAVWRWSIGSDEISSLRRSLAGSTEKREPQPVA